MDDADRRLVQRLRSRRVYDEAQGLLDLFGQHPALWPLNDDARNRLIDARRLIDNVLAEDWRRASGGGAMKGSNVLTVNERTLCEMVGGYMADRLFKPGEAPLVIGVKPRIDVPGNGQTRAAEWLFDIHTEGPREKGTASHE